MEEMKNVNEVNEVKETETAVNPPAPAQTGSEVPATQPEKSKPFAKGTKSRKILTTTAKVAGGILTGGLLFFLGAVCGEKHRDSKNGVVDADYTEVNDPVDTEDTF